MKFIIFILLINGLDKKMLRKQKSRKKNYASKQKYSELPLKIILTN